MTDPMPEPDVFDEDANPDQTDIGPDYPTGEPTEG